MTTQATLLTPRWEPLRQHAVQLQYVHSPARFNVVPAGRRSGKTERAKRKLVRRALTAKTAWAPRFFAGAPTHAQAKTIFWADFKALVPRWALADISISELTLRLINGAEIHVLGLDKPERMEGSPWDGGILDEYGNMKPQAWPENVRPALSDRKGWCDLIGVPEGRNHYYDLWKYAISGVDPEWAGFTWPSADILDPEEIAAAKRQLDDLTYQQEYEGSFINFEGRAYYPYQEETHTARLRELYNPRAPLIFCFDFNVDPGVAAVIQEQDFGTAVIGEVHIPRNSNTPAVCRKLMADWGSHLGEVRCYGDATGGARGTASVAGNDWDLIRTELREAYGLRVEYRVKLANPQERARVNAVNSRLRSKGGDIRLKVDPRYAPNVCKDFEGVSLLKGGSGEIDKKADARLSHLTDGIGYYIDKEFPINLRVAVQSNG